MSPDRSSEADYEVGDEDADEDEAQKLDDRLHRLVGLIDDDELLEAHLAVAICIGIDLLEASSHPGSESGISWP